MQPQEATDIRSALRCCLIVGLILWPCTVMSQELYLPKGEIEAGRILFLKICAKCHGPDASDGSARDIQGMILKDMTDAACGVEAMPKIALSDEEAGSIADYMMSLAPDQARLRLGHK